MAIIFFEYKSHGKSVPDPTPKITIYTSGQFAINKACYDKFFQDYEHTILGYDKEKQQIVFKPLKKSTDNSYPIRKTKEGLFFLVSGQAFLTYYNLRYHCRMGKGIPAEFNEKEKVVVIQLGLDSILDSIIYKRKMEHL